MNKANDHGNVALHYSCFFNHDSVAQYLVNEAHGSLALKNKYQRTPLGRTTERLRALLQDNLKGQKMQSAQARTFIQAQTEAQTRFFSKGMYLSSVVNRICLFLLI